MTICESSTSGFIGQRVQSAARPMRAPRVRQMPDMREAQRRKALIQQMVREALLPRLLAAKDEGAFDGTRARRASLRLVAG